MTNSPQSCSAESCDLKPCPFCGGKGAITLGVTLRETQTVDVICQDCGGTMPAFSEEEAANDWNARTDPAEKCPRPVIPDHSAKACIESGNCGCGARIPDDAQPAPEPVASVVPCYVPSGKRVALYSKYQDLPIGTELYAAPPPAATVETSAPTFQAPQNNAERLPSSDAAEVGADTQCSAGTGGVYGAKSLPPGVSIASANKAIEFLEWLSGYIGHGPAVQINSKQMEYIRSKVHPLVHELDGRTLNEPQGAGK